MNLIKTYLIPYLICDKEQETSVIKKANDFISFKFGDVQFLDIMKFLGGATILDFFLKAYKASETKGFFPYEWFDNPVKLDFPELPPYEAFFSQLINNNPLDKDFIEYEKLRKSGIDEQQALKKIQIKTVPPSDLDKYNYLEETWKKNGMTVFKGFEVVQQQRCSSNPGGNAKNDSVLSYVKTWQHTSKSSKQLSTQIHKSQVLSTLRKACVKK